MISKLAYYQRLSENAIAQRDEARDVARRLYRELKELKRKLPPPQTPYDGMRDPDAEIIDQRLRDIGVINNDYFPK